MKSLQQLLRFFFFYVAVPLAAMWCVLAIYFNSRLPRWLAVTLAIVFAITTAIIWHQSKTRLAFLKFFVPAAAIIFLAWTFVRPPQREWSQFHAIKPSVEFKEDQQGAVFSIRDVRNTKYADDGSFQVEHENRTCAAKDLQSIWFGVQYFSSLRSVAHTFVSFEFPNDDFLTISIESRRTEGEGFSPLRGMFKQYELIYVISSEEDALGGRELVDGMPVHLYPIRADQQQMQAMFEHMLRRTQKLHDVPESYHPIHSNCTTNIIDSFNQIAPIRISRYSPVNVLPGVSGKMAYRQGLIDTEKTFAEVHEQAHINPRAVDAPKEVNFSRYIREQFK